MALELGYITTAPPTIAAEDWDLDYAIRPGHVYPLPPGGLNEVPRSETWILGANRMIGQQVNTAGYRRSNIEGSRGGGMTTSAYTRGFGVFVEGDHREAGNLSASHIDEQAVAALGSEPVFMATSLYRHGGSQTPFVRGLDRGVHRRPDARYRRQAPVPEPHAVVNAEQTTAVPAPDEDQTELDRDALAPHDNTLPTKKIVDRDTKTWQIAVPLIAIGLCAAVLLMKVNV